MEENLAQGRRDEIEIDLGELFFYLLSKLGYMVLAAAALGSLALAFTFFFIKPTYTSTTKMYVLNRQSTDVVTQSDLSSSMSLTGDYVELIKDRSVLETVIAQQNLNMSYEELRGKLSVSSKDNTRIISISVTDRDPYEARDLANAIREEASVHIQSVMNIEAVNMVEEANVPTRRSSPNYKRNALLAAMIGALLVAAYFVIIFLMDDKINTSEDVERYLGLSVLGSLPIDENLQKHSKKKKNQHKRTMSRSVSR